MRRPGLGRPPGGAGRGRSSIVALIRPATSEDASACAGLILEPPGGLLDLVGDRLAALRMARAAFLSPRTAFSVDRSLVADDQGGILGQIVRIPGVEWRQVRVRTGLAMLRAAGLRAGLRLLWRGPIEARLLPPIPTTAMYVVSLAVVPQRRGGGLGALLLERVIAEARDAGLSGVALDVAHGNDGAIRFYHRLGFLSVSDHHVPAMRGRPAIGSVRMELSLDR